MRLLYLANNRIPSEKANSLQIMQMCQAFRKRGAEVTLVVPIRLQPRVMRSVADPFAYYGIKDRFPIAWLPCLDTLEIAPGALQHPAFALQSATFTAALAGFVATRRADLYYSRDPFSTVLLAGGPAWMRRRALYEAHTFPGPGRKRQLHLWAIGRIGGVVCITRGLAEEYLSRGMPPERVMVAPDAVDLERFSDMPSLAEARLALGIPASARVVCYTGHLYEWKGVHTLARASGLLPDDFLVYLVGGTVEDVAGFRRFLTDNGLTGVRLVGHVPPDGVLDYLAAADVLVLPNTASDLRSARYTSPMKLFEYMAARRPIVASRLPAIQEVLRHEENALLVEPDEPAAMAEAILRLASSPETAGTIARRAAEEVREYSWVGRAQAILDFAEGTAR